jgi:hypothetical protein
VTLRPFESLRVAPSRVEGRLASLAQGGALRLAALAEGKARLIVVAVWTAAFVAIVGDTPLLACPVCFGAKETAMIDGAKLGVLVLLAITLVVQGGFLAFFLYLRKRAKLIADLELDDEWSELQRSPRTS